MLLLVFAMISTSAVLASSSPLTLVSTMALAMKHVTSAHITMQLQATTDIQYPAFALLDKQSTLSITATGVEARFDQQLALTLTQGSAAPVHLMETITHNHLYLQFPAGPPLGVALPPAPATITGTTHLTTYSTLLQALAALQLTDAGTVNMHGTSLHKVTIAFTTPSVTQALQAIVPKDPALLQPLYQRLLSKKIQHNAGTIDLYIDNATSLLHEVHLQGMFQVQLNQMNTWFGSIPLRTATTHYNATISMGQFNQPTTIQAPAHAVQLSGPQMLTKSLQIVGIPF
jgi:hypothetical protein